jgi:hypothetical protein
MLTPHHGGSYAPGRGAWQEAKRHDLYMGTKSYSPNAPGAHEQIYYDNVFVH